MAFYRFISLNNKIYYIPSILSASIFILTNLAPAVFFNIIALCNSAVFIFFFLGSNLYIFFFLKEGTNRIEFCHFLIFSIIIGILVNIILGHILIALFFPFYSSCLPLILGIIHAITIKKNLDKKEINKIIIEFDEHSRNQIFIFLSLFAVRAFFINPYEMTFDNVIWTNMAIRFSENSHVLSEIYADIEVNYPLGIPILFGTFLSTINIVARWEVITSIKLILLIGGNFIVFPIYSFSKEVLKKSTLIIFSTILICFNAWILTWTYMIFVDIFFFFFFCSGCLCIMQFFQHPENGKLLYFSGICFAINITIKLNGIIQAVFFIIFMIGIAFNTRIPFSRLRKYFELKHVQEIPFLKKKIIRTILFIFIFYLIVPFSFTVQYYFRNGFSPITGFFIHPIGIFSSGPMGSYSPFPGISWEMFGWILERLSINIPTVAISLNALFGYLEFPIFGAEISPFFYRIESLFLLIIFIFGQITSWKNQKEENPPLFFMLFFSFWINFSWIFLVPFEYFSMMKYIYLVAILLIPNLLKSTSNLSKSLHNNAFEQIIHVSLLIFTSLGIAGLISIIPLVNETFPIIYP